MYRHGSQARFGKTGGVFGRKPSAKMQDSLVLGPASSWVGPPRAAYSSPFSAPCMLCWVKPKRRDEGSAGKKFPEKAPSLLVRLLEALTGVGSPGKD